MTLSARKYLLAAASGLAVSILPAMGQAASHSASEAVVEVADGVYAFDPQDGYNSMFIVTDDGVIAIESVNSAHAAGLLEAIKSVTDQPVRFLLNSHNHWDHASGGGVFRAAGATIVSHAKATEWLYQRSIDPEPMRPFAHAEGHDLPWLVDEVVPGLAAQRDDAS